MKIDILPETTL